MKKFKIRRYKSSGTYKEDEFESDGYYFNNNGDLVLYNEDNNEKNIIYVFKYFSSCQEIK